MLVQKFGLTHYDQASSTPGFTLFSGAFSDKVFLINMSGDIVHEWLFQGWSTNFNYLLPNGNLFTCEKVDDGPPLLGKGGRMCEYDWEGNKVWEHLDEDQHHDARRLSNGNTVYIAWNKLTSEESKCVKGGLPGTEMNGEIYGEVIREIDNKGNVVWEFFSNTPEFIDKYAINPLAKRYEFGHANTVAPITNGDYLVSYRNLNLLVIIDRKTNKIKWEYHNPELGGQHDAQLLDNGNILVFANGFNVPGAMPFGSQVWELDPISKEIVWKYVPKRNCLTFWSPHISGCQRLISGNTLICEGGQGCIFETTPEGEVVWEYINPYFIEHPVFGEFNWVFRAKRYTKNSPEIRSRV
jgi:hypothetical protein